MFKSVDETKCVTIQTKATDQCFKEYSVKPLILCDHLKQIIGSTFIHRSLFLNYKKI